MENYVPSVAYHQFYLTPRYVDPPEYDIDSANDLMQKSDDERSLIITTNIAQGPIGLVVHTLTREPDESFDSALREWECGEEVALIINEDLHISTPTIEQVDVPGAIFSPSKPGRHRLRVLARGRSAHYDHVVEEPTEHFDLTFWPESE